MKLFMKKMLFCVTSTTLIIIAYLFAMNIVKEKNLYSRISNSRLSVDYSILAELESIEIVKNKYLISGWGLVCDAKQDEINIVLQAADGTEVIIHEGRRTKRKDIERCYRDEYISGETGFTVSFDADELQENVVYEVLLDIAYYSKEQISAGDKWDLPMTKKVALQQYIYNGKIYDTNPLNNVIPNIISEKIKEVLDKGIFCKYVSEYKTWIYLYNNSLHFLIESNDVNGLDKRPSIPSGIYTRDEENIAKEDAEIYQKYGYILREIYLEESHLIKENDLTYMYVSVQLPQDCSVTYVHTGLYMNHNPQGFLFEENIPLYRFDREGTE